MSMSVGGRTYQLVREQARRISACRLTFLTSASGAEQRLNGAFVRGAISLAGVQSENRQAALWEERVRLDEGFWASLREHPVPVREEAIFAIGTRSMAMDVYIWLAPTGYMRSASPHPSLGRPYRGNSPAATRMRALCGQFSSTRSNSP
jgi:hypothetical protein